MGIYQVDFQPAPSTAIEYGLKAGRYVMGNKNPIGSVFSGSDTICYIGKKYWGGCMAMKLGKGKARGVFAIEDGFNVILNSCGFMELDLIGINEAGQKSHIKGLIRVLDWEIDISVDTLNTEAVVDFEFQLKFVKGHLSTTDEQQKEISEYWWSLRDKDSKKC